MFQISSEETYKDGDIIFREGNAGDWIYEVLAGQVEIIKQIEDRQVVIEKIGPGDVFGELGFISKAPRSATAKAVGNTMVGILDRSFLDEEYNKLSSDFQRILQTLSRRLRVTTDMAITAQVVRRRQDRVRKGLTLVFKSPAGLVNAFSEDMSISGMFIRTPTPLAVDELFNLKMVLPSDPDTPLEIGCQVCWARNEAQAKTKGLLPGMGVKFVEISDEDQQRLKKELKGYLATATARQSL